MANDTVEIQFMSLTGPFRTVKKETFQTSADALAAVRSYAESAGFTDVKLVTDDDPYDGFRYTGKTPGGRSGRNVAFGDWYVPEAP